MLMADTPTDTAVAAPRETALDPGLADGLVSAAPTGLGDPLRSVVYFTPAAFNVLYVRQDRYERPAAAREARRELVAFERPALDEGPTRSRLAHRPEGSDIGPYRFTVRLHEHGSVVRVLGAGDGVLLTDDSMDVRAFEEAAVAVRGLLEG